MEVTATLLAIDLVETIAPVNTHHTDHRQIDTGSHTGRALDVKRVEVLDMSPGITTLDKHERIDGGTLGEHQREVQLKDKAVISITLRTVGRERTVLITAQGNGLGGVGLRA